MVRENRELKKLKDYDIESLLIEARQGRKLICFGAGKALETFLDKMADYAPEEYIYAIADNDLEKQGTIYEARGKKEIQILSPDILFGSGGVSLPIIVLITSRDLMGMYAELGNYPRLMNSSVAFYGYIIDRLVEKNIRDGRYDCRIVHEDGIQIPKVIHYCWFGKNPIPDCYREWMKSWKRYCPDYEIVEWNEDNYDVNKHPYMAQAYSKKRWQFVSDYARLDIIYQHGGVYLDTDVELVRSLDSLMHQSAFIGFENFQYVNSGLGFGAISLHPVIRTLRDDYDNRKFIRDDGSLDLTPCPQYQTECLERMGLKKNGRFQQIQGIAVYPKMFFSPLSPYGMHIIKHKNTFSVHHFAASWVDEKTIETRNRSMEIFSCF